MCEVVVVVVGGRAVRGVTFQLCLMPGCFGKKKKEEGGVHLLHRSGPEHASVTTTLLKQKLKYQALAVRGVGGGSPLPQPFPTLYFFFFHVKYPTQLLHYSTDPPPIWQDFVVKLRR